MENSIFYSVIKYSGWRLMIHSLHSRYYAADYPINMTFGSWEEYRNAFILVIINRMSTLYSHSSYPAGLTNGELIKHLISIAITNL